MSLTYADDKLVRGAEVLEIYQEAGWALHCRRSPEEIEASIRHATFFVCARDGAKLAGFATALSDRTYYAQIVEFLIRPRYKGRGVDAELLRRLLETLKAERMITIFAEPDAEAFYRRLGFSPTAGGMILHKGD